MKIEHHLQTEVSRFATVNDALRALYPQKGNEKSRHEARRMDVVSGLMYGTFHVENLAVQADPRGEAAIATVRRQMLSREHEGLVSYQLTCAHVSLDREWRIPELWNALDKGDYRPAGLNESTAYLRLLTASGTAIGTTFHLGTHIVNELYQEQKLLAFDDGRLELVTIYKGTMVRPHWHVVAAKKEVKPLPASVIFGRQK